MAVMLTLRSALTGTGNLVGQDVRGLPLTEPEELIGRLVDSGWLSIPGTADDLLESRPESPTPITIPSLMPDDDGQGAVRLRPEDASQAQRVGPAGASVTRAAHEKTGAATRLLALALAVRTSTDGRLGADGEGIDVAALTSWCAVEPDELEPLVEQLTAADWLAEAAVTDGRLTGRLAERVLQVSCPLP
ncbi:putative protein OS=Streptomyces microflavus OX=1919 GN=Smic_82100 PE=4 SV=1 [Streptomyces microflavus]